MGEGGTGQILSCLCSLWLSVQEASPIVSQRGGERAQCGDFAVLGRSKAEPRVTGAAAVTEFDAACNSKSRESDTPFWSLGVLHSHTDPTTTSSTIPYRQN